jgi:hypothetical protein
MAELLMNPVVWLLIFLVYAFQRRSEQEKQQSTLEEIRDGKNKEGN